jgi:aminopeptidase YwaD
MSNSANVPEVREEHVKHVFALTDEVVDKFPGRVAGSEACRKAGERVKEEFEKYCDRGSVKMEEFNVHPQSFLKYIPGLVVLYLAGALLLYFGLNAASLVCFSVAILVFYAQFIRYHHLLDPLFPRKKGYNISGSIEPQSDVKQQIIICAHHDAAYVFQILARFPKLYFPFMMGGVLLLVIGFLVSLFASILYLFDIHLPHWVALVLISCGVFELPFLFFTTNQVVPGAGDNMVAVAIAGETGRLFNAARQPGMNPLKHTRLILASFDAEEAGIRGAQAFVREHRKELTGTKTYVLNMDTIYRLRDLNFFDADLNSTVWLSREMAQECVDIARALGYNAKISRMSPGGGSTDAAAFGQAGIEATNLSAMSFDVKDYSQGFVYHTERDVSSHIEPEVVEAALKIIRGYIQKKDAEVTG